MSDRTSASHIIRCTFKASDSDSAVSVMYLQVRGEKKENPIILKQKKATKSRSEQKRRGMSQQRLGAAKWQKKEICVVLYLFLLQLIAPHKS